MELPILTGADRHDAATLTRAARSAHRPVAQVLGTIFSTDAAECVVDASRPDVPFLNAVLQLDTAWPGEPAELLEQIRDAFEEHHSRCRWIVPTTDDVPSDWQAALEAGNYERTRTTLLARSGAVRIAPETPTGGPAQSLPARAVIGDYRSFLEKVIHINNSQSEHVGAALGLLDVDSIDIIVWRQEGLVAAEAVIQTVGDLGLIRVIRVDPEATSPALEAQIVDGVGRWCSRCQFRGVISGSGTGTQLPATMIEPLGLQEAATYTTWRHRS